jgi:hypothetical protein
MTFTDPVYQIQLAVVSALKSASAVSAIIGTRVFDRVSPEIKPPYITISDIVVLPELAEDTDAAGTTLAIHGWSENSGSAEIYKMGAAVTTALHEAPLIIAGKQVQSILLESSRYLRDPDGITSHGVFTFNILTDAS